MIGLVTVEYWCGNDLCNENISVDMYLENGCINKAVLFEMLETHKWYIFEDNAYCCKNCKEDGDLYE